MAEEQRYLYHCDRCGELFKSQQHAKEDIRCDSCGEHPVRPRFAAVTDMPALDNNDKKDNHGIPGKDVADIFSMNRKKKRQKWMAMGLVWVIGLVALVLTVKHMNNETKEVVKGDLELDDAEKSYLLRKKEAYEKCANRFISFLNASKVHSKSPHILNQSELVLDIKRYYQENSIIAHTSSPRLVNFNLIEDDDQPKALALFRYKPKSRQIYEFEVLFWKKGEDWFIDWPHFVRLGDMSWLTFNESMEKKSPKRFKLYARELSTESVGVRGYQEYKFSKAHNHSTASSHSSKSVLVKQQTALKTKLNKAFREFKENNTASNQASESFTDPPRTIRVDVTVDFKEIEGETRMVLEEIHGLEWETPPTKEN